MSMSKKDFEAIARLLKYQREKAQPKSREDELAKICINSTLDIAAHSIADYCKSDNPRFDRVRFLVACGVT